MFYVPFVKRLVRGMASQLFRISILLIALVSAFVINFHSPKKIEKSLSQSGVYSTFVDNVLAEAKKANANNTSSVDIPIDDPAVKTAAHQAFSPSLLQKSTNNFLNGTYDWLSGKTKTPDFTIELSGAKQTFAQSIATEAGKRANALSACTITQIQQLSSQQIDLFNLPCKPPGVNISTEQTKLANDITTSPDFLATPKLTAQNLPKNSQGQTIFDKLAYAPKVYKLLNASPWLLTALALVSGALVIWLYDSKRFGIRKLAISIGITGIILIIYSIVGSWSLHKVTQPGGVLANNVNGNFQQTALKGVNLIYNSINQVIIWFAIAYLIIAIVTILTLYFTRTKPLPTTKPKQDLPKPAEVPVKK